MANVNVAKILLEDKLGYKVELVTIDENAQWAALATGDLSASLEVWPSGHADNVKQFIDDQKKVEKLGELGGEGAGVRGGGGEASPVRGRARSHP